MVYEVTSVSEDAFKPARENNPNGAVETVTLPSTIRTIGANAFRQCQRLKSITIPDSVESIGDSAFFGCTSLTSIEIPRAVTFIGTSVFDHCRIREFSVDPGNPYYCSVNGVLFDKAATVLIAYPGGSSPRDYTVPPTVFSIAPSAFCRSRLRSVRLPEGLVSIENYAFYDCGDLETVNLPETLTKVGEYAFSECHSLESISIPKSVSIIGRGALVNRYLRNITVDPENPYYTSDKGVLFDKQKKTLVLYPPDRQNMMYKIPDSVEIIRTMAFSNCSNLEVITIPSSVKVLEKDAAVGYFSPPVRVPKTLYIRDVFRPTIDVLPY